MKSHDRRKNVKMSRLQKILQYNYFRIRDWKYEVNVTCQNIPIQISVSTDKILYYAHFDLRFYADNFNCVGTF